MTKLLSILVISTALFLGGAAFADDETPLDPYPTTQNHTGASKTQDQSGTPAQQSKQNEEYLVALKKCQDLQDASKQQECIEQAKQKYNRM
jgi:hypothetical protein